MPTVEGLTELQATLRGMLPTGPAKRVIQVGFSQRYALVVHEDMNANHPVGQAKYLEEPTKTHLGEFKRILREVYKSASRSGSYAAGLEKALLVVGRRLQREAQLLVPVDTSALKASAYTAVEMDANAAAQEAFVKSEVIRLAGGKKK